ncbi:hypothetical protein HPB50_027592 [Hyalomma asiaticum]|uniref:Uncharacterized protein n=1 Tax=Hyalomma asiaticum TaxID=266040 RepID=A0ACB7SYW9_HYAAI|nr:hypothetical protein HPB50_027592 [Hyalomma asiaticum]
MRGAGVDAVRRKEAACGRHTAMTVHHARPAVRDRVSSVSSSLAAKTARKREIGESDFGSGGERTRGVRYPSWVRHHLGYAPSHGRLIAPPATLRRPQRRPRTVPTAPKTLHISCGGVDRRKAAASQASTSDSSHDFAAPVIGHLHQLHLYR